MHFLDRFQRVCRLTFGCNSLFFCIIAIVQFWLGLLWFFYWDYGIERGIILGVLLVILVGLQFRPRPSWSEKPPGAALLPCALRGLLIAAVLLDLGTMVDSDARSIVPPKFPWMKARQVGAPHAYCGAVKILMASLRWRT